MGDEEAVDGADLAACSVTVPRVTIFQNVDDRAGTGASRAALAVAVRFAAATEAAASPSLASWTRSHLAYSPIHWSPGIESMLVRTAAEAAAGVCQEAGRAVRRASGLCVTGATEPIQGPLADAGPLAVSGLRSGNFS